MAVLALHGHAGAVLGTLFPYELPSPPLGLRTSQAMYTPTIPLTEVLPYLELLGLRKLDI